MRLALRIEETFKQDAFKIGICTYYVCIGSICMYIILITYNRTYKSNFKRSVNLIYLLYVISIYKV